MGSDISKDRNSYYTTSQITYAHLSELPNMPGIDLYELFSTEDKFRVTRKEAMCLSFFTLIILVLFFYSFRFLE